VLRVAAIHIPERGSVPASSMVDWLNHLAGQATRQAELWAAAATLLRDVASEFAPDGDAELAPANVMWRLTERADAISHGQLSYRRCPQRRLDCCKPWQGGPAGIIL
jgi:hypothetical protein